MTRLVIFVSLIGCSLANAYGGLMYQLRFEQTDIQLQVGESQTIGVLFDEIYTAPDTPIFDLASDALPINGLTTADFTVTTSGAGGSSITAAAGNAHFDFPGNPLVLIAGPATVEQTILFNTPLFASESGNVRTAQIGSITVTGGGNVGDTNTFSLADFNPTVGVANFIIDDGFGSGAAFAADALMAGNPAGFGTLNATVANVATVPEPSMITALTMLCCAGGYRRYRRKSGSESDL